jgi:hypothetical protein
MSHRHYEIYLPTRYNDGSPIGAAAFMQTRQELAGQFGACSFFPETFHGTWIFQGQAFEDENVRICVDVEDTPENAAFFDLLKARLKERFRQLEIWIVSFEIRVL